MIESRIEKLLSIASPPISSNDPRKFIEQLDIDTEDLFRMLSLKNGFYAFESSLHVFPSKSSDENFDLEVWNSPDLWKQEYGNLVEGLFFFAEDIFGSQFCLAKDGVYMFDPETAKREKIAPDLEEWADCLLVDYNYLTGYPIARKWQEIHGSLLPNNRLIPTIPFVCRGSYELENIYSSDSVKGMKWRGYLATQIKDLPDGAKIKFTTIHEKNP